jgi:hypothetical protein
MSNRRLLIAAVAACCVSCSASNDEEAELRLLVDSAEIAAEERQTGYFRSLLAESYADNRGNNHERMIEILRGYFLMHPSLEIVTRIDTIELLGADAAAISLLAGVVGQRTGGLLLGGVDGRLYDLDIELVRSGSDWQVIGATWDRAADEWDGGEIPELE